MGDIFQSLPTLVVMPQSDIEDETPFKKTENKTMHSGLNWGVMWTFEHGVSCFSIGLQLFYLWFNTYFIT